MGSHRTCSLSTQPNPVTLTGPIVHQQSVPFSGRALCQQSFSPDRVCLWGRRPAHPHPHGLLSLQRLQSGSTGVCALIAGKTLHIAWLGDSQVILVQQGQVVKLMEPHKPERQVRGSLHPQGTSRAQLCWAHQGSGWSESPGRSCWGELGSNRGLGPPSRRLLVLLHRAGSLA